MPLDASRHTGALRVGIVGGGPGGLLVSDLIQRSLRDRFSITIFESGTRLGGKVHTGSFAAGMEKYETAAAELYDYSELGVDPLRELVDELGLTRVPLRGFEVLWRNRLLRGPADIRSELGDAAADCVREFGQLARTLLGRNRFRRAERLPPEGDVLARQSFEDLLLSVPEAKAREYIRVICHSDLGCEPHETNARYGLHNFLLHEPQSMQIYTIEEGLGAFTQALACRSQARTLLGHCVRSVERITGHYRITAAAGTRPVAEEFDYIVVALPSEHLAGISWRGAALADAMDQHHRRYYHPGHYVRVSILFDHAFWRGAFQGSYIILDAFGGCCVYDETRRGAGTSRGVLGWLIAGDAADRLSRLPDADLIAEVLASLPRAWSRNSRKYIDGRVHRWIGGVSVQPGGCGPHGEISRHRPEPTFHPRLCVVGGYLYDCTLNGVLDSAQVVARWLCEDAAASAA